MMRVGGQVRAQLLVAAQTSIVAARLRTQLVVGLGRVHGMG